MNSQGGTRLIRRADALADGFSDNHLRRARDQGVLITIAPGVYVEVSEINGMDNAHRHRATVSAVVPGLTGNPVVSHLSAAILHGLPIDCGPAEPVHVIKSGTTKSRRGPGVQVHRARLTPGEVVRLYGVAVTSAARTVIDCAVTMPMTHSVALARAALNGGSVTAADLALQLTRHTRVPGVRRAAAVLDRAFAETANATGSL